MKRAATWLGVYIGGAVATFGVLSVVNSEALEDPVGLVLIVLGSLAWPVVIPLGLALRKE
jgi:hypothetical protein